MPSQIGPRVPGIMGRRSWAMRRRGGLPSMSEKQTQAYLIARDTLRRIGRTCSLVLPMVEKGSGGDRSDTTRTRDRAND
jgi:hypothetical protein